MSNTRPDPIPELNPKARVKMHQVVLPKKIAENWFHFVIEEDQSINFIWADPDDLIEDSDLGENSE